MAVTKEHDLTSAGRRDVDRAVVSWTGGVVTPHMRLAGLDRRHRSTGTPVSLFNAAAKVMARTGNVSAPQRERADLALVKAIEPERAAEIVEADEKRKLISNVVELNLPPSPEPDGSSVSDADIKTLSEPLPAGYYWG